MDLLYIDESGTSDVPGNTSHFVLAGLSIPILRWKTCDSDIERIKKAYNLSGSEIHVAWILRAYPEQRQVSAFDKLDYSQRRIQVEKQRTTELLRLQRAKNPGQYKQTKKNYKKTQPYVHLTFEQRKKLIREIADCVSQWGFARLFAEAVDKAHYTTIPGKGIDEQAFEQIVSRFERFLSSVGASDPNCCGLLIHDNNETVAKKHTALMKSFHQTGTMWTAIAKIIETPLFVDSQLTSMVQIADLCAYAIRRYLENHEEELFDLIFKRADRNWLGTVVGVRHFTALSCTCKICTQHRVQLPLSNRPSLI